MNTPQRRKVFLERGFTLIELLITVAVLAVLMIMLLIAWRGQINRARDAQRKADLEKIKIAFENYYNDKECFPDQDILQVCRGDALDPYLDKIPCDPVFDLPYCYIHDETNPCGQSYKILAPLKDSNDPIIEKLFCGGDLYCGYEPNCEALINPPAGASYEGFNYGVTSGNVQLFNPDASASPGAFNYACDNAGVCNSTGVPQLESCPTFHSYETICTVNCCLGDCSDPNNWCD